MQESFGEEYRTEQDGSAVWYLCSGRIIFFLFFCDTWHSLFHGQEKEKKRKERKRKRKIAADML
jgi:hypothetical protein